MAYSRIQKIATGVDNIFTVNFALDYLKIEDVTAWVTGEYDGLGAKVYRAITPITVNSLSLGGALITAAKVVVFERTVAADELVVDFEDDKVINEETLNTAQKQALMLIQQILDGRLAPLTDNLDLGGNRAINAADGLSPQDLVTLAQLTSYIVNSGNVPVPGAPNIGKWLKALSATTFGWTSLSVADISDLITNYLRINGTNSMTGDLSMASANPTINLQKSASGGNASITAQTNGNARMQIRVANPIAEGGGNSGSNFDILRFNDAGAPQGTPLSINRATGVITTETRPVFGVYTPWDQANFYPGGKNFLINGSFNISQRGTVFNTPSSGLYNLDRWRVDYDGTIGTFAISQLVHPTGSTWRKYFQWNHTVAGSSSTARNLTQKIRDVRTLAGKQITLSFNANMDITRSVGIVFAQNFGSGGSPSAIVATSLGSVSVTAAGARYSVTATLPNLAGKTIGSNEDSTLDVVFQLPINTTMLFRLWDVQLELGPVATEFEFKPFEQELAECLPYYEKSFPYVTAPAQAAGLNGALTSQVFTAGFVNQTQIRYRVRKIKIPTFTTYNPSAANAFWRDTTVSTDFSANSSVGSTISEDGICIGGSGGTHVVGNVIAIHWTAEAEL